MSNVIKPQKKPKHTREWYLKDVAKNPGKYKTTKAHVDKVDKMVRKADKVLEGYEKKQRGEPVEDIKLDLGVFVRVSGRLGIIREFNEDVVIVEFPTKSKTIKEYPIEMIKAAKDQDKARKKWDELMGVEE